MTIIQSSSKGALLLWIDAQKPIKLMDDDDKLDLLIHFAVARYEFQID